MVEAGDMAPEFCLPDQEGSNLCLKDMMGKWLVLYFYPKDNTKGCTMEAMDFTLNLDRFSSLGASILGISPDSVKSHVGFAEKNDLRIRLLSDESHEVLEKYGVWQLKKMYGREYHGVVRSTFIIGPDGRIEKKWEKVKVGGHVEKVLSELEALIKDQS